ncbi:MAG: DJ-1/PfpI/YhbO family deglycase/protease [Candidatus Omnitrophica bacterium]|nr:DJ-1/PfpI/YhbO family deglycase/protease [Candidatus Omnitrophota bacterium]
MARIAVIIDDMFEDSEYTEPVKAFKDRGHETVHVGMEADKEVEGKKEGTKVKVDKSVNDVKADEFDAMLIPGGYSPDKLRAHDEAVGLVKAFMEKEKPVFAICHGPQLLISAGVLEGRKVTCWKSLVQDVKNAGAEYLDQVSVEDGNLITSRQPSDLPVFIRKCLDKLSDKENMDTSFCDTSGTAEHARIYDEDQPCKEQDE